MFAIEGVFWCDKKFDGIVEGSNGTRLRENNTMMMTMLRLIVVAALVGVSTVEAASSQQWIGQRGEKMMSSSASSSFLRASSNATTMDPFAALKQKGPSREFLEKERRERQARNKERKKAFREKVASWRPSEPEKLERVSQEQFDKMQGDRSLGWMSGSSGGSTYSASLADPTQDYDMWAQAYRMLGGFIDCDHDKDDDDHNSQDNNNNNNNYEKTACSRWMMWAAVRIIMWQKCLWKAWTRPRCAFGIYPLVFVFQILTYPYLFVLSMSTPTIREMDTMNTLVMMLLAYWTVIVRTRNGS